MTRTKTPVVFMHIGKNGGSTLWQMFKNIFGSKNVYHIFSKPLSFSENGTKLRAALDHLPHEGLRIMGGHVLFMPQYAQTYPHITMLRNPIERHLSLYYFALRIPQHTHHTLFNDANMSIEKALRLLPDNGHIRYLVTGFDRPVTRDDLEQAKVYLEHQFATFGMLEHYNESLILFKHTFDWPTPYYFIKHVAQNKPKQIADEVRLVAAEHNALDVELYAWAETLFKQRIASQPLTFQQDMQRFEWMLPLWTNHQTVRRMVKFIRKAKRNF